MGYRDKHQRAEQLREMADECRALAAVTKSRDVGKQLLEIAEQFEALARHIDRNGTRTPNSNVRC